MSLRLVLAVSCLPFLLLYAGCTSTHFLSENVPLAASSLAPTESGTEEFARTYRFSREGSLISRTHILIRAGTRSPYDRMEVYDGSMERLIAFEARVIHPGGGIDRYDLDDLETVSLKSQEIIAERALKFARLRRVPAPGGVVEMAYEHDVQLPQLGIRFAVDEAGSYCRKVSCTFSIPPGDTLIYQVLNGSHHPVISRTPGATEYSFVWSDLSLSGNRWTYQRTNTSPTILAVAPGRGPTSWKSFGEWYLDAIEPRTRPDAAILTAIGTVVTPGMTDAQKMNAIVDYCQRRFRYEQVYLERGEFIPNDASTIFSRKFGDCKDVSVMILAMAQAAGLHPHPVLCHRGLGFEVCGGLPVAQFNHMIVHFQANGRESWYDGTNPPGAPDIAPWDLANGTALVLERCATRLAIIPEDPANRLVLDGALHVRGESLAGRIVVRLTSQYAVTFRALHRYANQTDMHAALVNWLRQNVAERIKVQALRWEDTGDAFSIEATCEIPNALWQINDTAYVRFDKVFDGLLSQEDPSAFPEGVYHYPYFGRVRCTIDLPDFPGRDGSGCRRWNFACDLPPGPFSPSERADFLLRYTAARTQLSRTLNLQQQE